MTGLYDMLIQMSEELRNTKQELQELKLENERELEATKQRQLVTEKELIATREILNIGNMLKSWFVFR